MRFNDDLDNNSHLKKTSLKTPFSLRRATVSPGRAGAPHHRGSSTAGWKQGQLLLLPHSWCPFPHPVPRDVPEDEDKLCPHCGHRSRAVVLWAALEVHREAWRRLHCIPPPVPVSAWRCGGWAEVVLPHGSPWRPHSFTWGPQWDPVLGIHPPCWSETALVCQPSGHAEMHIYFPKLRKTGRTLAGDHKDWNFLFIC